MPLNVVKKQTTKEKEAKPKKAIQINKDFYKVIYDSDGRFKEVKINYVPLSDLLYSFGFRRFDLNKDYIFIRIINRVLEEVQKHNVMDFFIEYLEKLPQILAKDFTRKMLIEKIYAKPEQYISETRLKLLKPKEKIIFNCDTKSESFVYYKNGFVKCTTEGYSLIPYDKLTGYIWKNQIINRDFTEKKTEEPHIDNLGVFAKFISEIANGDQDRFNSLCSIIGYNLHNFFEGKLKATIFTDSNLSENPEGRTGKTLLSKALGNIRRYVEINGKDFDNADKFKYQQLDLDTQIVCYNDVKNKFDFESLFNDITEGISINKKQTDAFTIRAKIIVTTNRALNIFGGSAKDRAIEFEFSDHYNINYNPEDQFKHWFFRDWVNDRAHEWVSFDNFMMYCLCFYLSNGLIEAKQINLDKRKVLHQTNPQFAEWIDFAYSSNIIQLDKPFDKSFLHNEFLSDYPDVRDERYFKTQRNFTKWLKIWADSNDDILRTTESRSGSVREITFFKKNGKP